MPKGKFWTMDEIRLVLAWKNPDAELAAQLGRTLHSIWSARRHYSKVLQISIKKWWLEDTERLRAFPKDTPDWLEKACAEFNRTETAILLHCHKHNIRYPRRKAPLFWTPKRLHSLKLAHNEGHDYSTLQARFGCGRLQIRNGLTILGIRYHHPWTPEQLEAARTWTPSCGETRLETARRLGVPALRFATMIASLRRQARYGKHRRKVRSPAPASTTPNELQPGFPMQGEGV